MWIGTKTWGLVDKNHKVPILASTPKSYDEVTIDPYDEVKSWGPLNGIWTISLFYSVAANPYLMPFNSY